MTKYHILLFVILDLPGCDTTPPLLKLRPKVNKRWFGDLTVWNIEMVPLECSPPAPASLRSPNYEENPPAGKNFIVNMANDRPSIQPFEMGWIYYRSMVIPNFSAQGNQSEVIRRRVCRCHAGVTLPEPVKCSRIFLPGQPSPRHCKRFSVCCIGITTEIFGCLLK